MPTDRPCSHEQGYTIHGSSFLRRPFHGVREEGFEGGEVVDAAVVADGEANDAGGGVLRGPHDGVRFREFE